MTTPASTSIPFVSLSFLRDYYYYEDPQEQMEWELTHHCEI